MRAFHVSVTVVCAAALLATSHFTVRPVAQQPDTTAALLVEVRGLRAALEQLASAGPRVQLMFGRLQLQEQRIASLNRHLGELREKMKPAMEQEESARSTVTRFETFLKEAPANHPERADIEKDLPRLRQAAAQAASQVQQLQQEQASTAAEIGLEQGRWMDINQRLEELERALVRK